MGSGREELTAIRTVAKMTDAFHDKRLFDQPQLLLVAELPPPLQARDHVDALDSHRDCHRDSHRDRPHDSASTLGHKAALGGGVRAGGCRPRSNGRGF